MDRLKSTKLEAYQTVAGGVWNHKFSKKVIGYVNTVADRW